MSDTTFEANLSQNEKEPEQTKASHIILPDPQKLAIIEKIADDYKIYLGDVKHNTRGREGQAKAWEKLRDWLEETSGAKYPSGSKLRAAFRQWRFPVDKKLKGTKQTGAGGVKLSPVEKAIYDLESFHGKRYDRNIMITVPDTGRPQAAKQVVAKKSSAKVPARQQGGSDGAGGGNGTVDASAVSLHTAMVRAIPETAASTSRAAASELLRPVCATPPRPRPTFVEVTPSGEVPAVANLFQPRVASSPQSGSNPVKETAVPASKSDSQEDQEKEWRQLRLDALKAQIRRDNAMALFFEKCAKKLDKPSEGQAVGDLLGNVANALGSGSGTGSGNGIGNGTFLLDDDNDPFLA